MQPSTFYEPVSQQAKWLLKDTHLYIFNTEDDNDLTQKSKEELKKTELKFSERWSSG